MENECSVEGIKKFREPFRLLIFSPLDVVGRATFHWQTFSHIAASVQRSSLHVNKQLVTCPKLEIWDDGDLPGRSLIRCSLSAQIEWKWECIRSKNGERMKILWYFPNLSHKESLPWARRVYGRTKLVDHRLTASLNLIQQKGIRRIHSVYYTQITHRG